MRAFDEFRNKDQSFWALVKYVSETLGYTDRRTRSICTYSKEKIANLLEAQNIFASAPLIQSLKQYFDMRASLLNDCVCKLLMTVDEAKEKYERLLTLYNEERFRCKLPENKQNGKMKRVNYFTAIINILAEDTIRKSSVYDDRSLGFNDDPRGLTYVLNDCGQLIGASSRRFDGAYPDLINPKIVWEIKEYYYTTTFGSRVADGIYETQLDGYEFRDINNKYGKKVIHVFFADAYKTWWEDGKSYLCRMIDILNAGLADEVIIGREVFTRWPELLMSVIEGS